MTLNYFAASKHLKKAHEYIERAKGHNRLNIIRFELISHVAACSMQKYTRDIRTNSLVQSARKCIFGKKREYKSKSILSPLSAEGCWLVNEVALCKLNSLTVQRHWQKGRTIFFRFPFHRCYTEMNGVKRSTEKKKCIFMNYLLKQIDYGLSIEHSSVNSSREWQQHTHTHCERIIFGDGPCVTRHNLS